MSMLSSSIVWLLFSYYLNSRVHDDQQIKQENIEDDGTSIKEEYGEASIKNEYDDTVKREEIEETTKIPPLGAQAGDHAENVETIRTSYYDNDSGIGSSFDGHSLLGAQRRRSHLSSLPES